MPPARNPRGGELGDNWRLPDLSVRIRRHDRP